MKSKRITLLLIITIIISIKTNIPENNYKIKDDEDLIDISSGYTHVNPTDRTYFYIALVGTNDIHGHFYPDQLEIAGHKYTQGGFDYLSKYINILRNEFPERVIYLDAGDLFQGSTESSFSNGDIMTESLNSMGCDGATFGVHEFEYSREFLEKKVSQSKFPYIASNIYDNKKKTKNAFGSNHIISKEYYFNVTNTYLYQDLINNEKLTNVPDSIKIGVVGLSTEMKKSEIKGEGYDDISFLNYKNELTEEAKKLRDDGCLAVVLLAHLGVTCGTEKNMELNMYTSKSTQDLCNSEDDLYQLVMSLDEGVIDGVIGGKSHQHAHHWVYDIPIISSLDQGFYASILYLPFRYLTSKKIYEIYKSKIQIEGPLPICEKVFEKTKRCDYVKKSEIENYLPLVNYKFHGVKIEKDDILNSIHEKYDQTYQNYNEKICEITGTEELLQVSENGDFCLGNIITDIQTRMTGAHVSIFSHDNLKTYWNPGKLPKYKINDLIPIKSNLCTFTMTGKEIKKMMSILQIGEKKYYLTNGIKQTITLKENGEYYLSDVKLFDGYKETDLILEKEYTVSTIEYLIKEGGNDFKNILSWYTPKNLNCNYGDIGDLIEKYLKAQQTVDVTKYKDEKNPKITFIQ